MDPICQLDVGSLHSAWMEAIMPMPKKKITAQDPRFKSCCTGQ